MHPRRLIQLRLALCGLFAAGGAVAFALSTQTTPPPGAAEVGGLLEKAGRGAVPEALVEAALVLLFAPFERLLRAGTSLAASAVELAGWGEVLDPALAGWPCVGFMGMTLTLVAVGVVSAVTLTRPQEDVL